MATSKKIKKGSKEKATKPEAKGKKKGKISYEGLSGIQLYQAKVKNGDIDPKKRKAKAGVAKKKITHKAPEDFRAFFIKARLTIGKEGFVSAAKVLRYKGRPDTENVKSVELSKFDPETYGKFLLAIASGTASAGDVKKRTPGSVFVVTARIGKKSGDKYDVLTAAIREVRYVPDPKVKKSKVLEKKDPLYRGIRKATKVLPGAFTKVGAFPSAAEIKAYDKAEAEANGTEVEKKTRKSREEEAPEPKATSKKSKKVEKAKAGKKSTASKKVAKKKSKK